MIRQISIRDYKSLRDEHIDLEQFTIFVGPNASGKSSILQARDLLCRRFRSDIRVDGNDIGHGVRRGATNGFVLACSTGIAAFRCVSQFQFDVGRPDGNGSRPPRITLGTAPNPNSIGWKIWEPNGETPSPAPLTALLRLEASRPIPSAEFGPDRTSMTANGTGVHSALAAMTLNDPDSWQRLQADLRRIIPTIRRLRFTKTAPYELLFDAIGGDDLRASQVSEGTLLVLGLLTAIHAPGRPCLILMDDLDRGLHPKAQKELVSLLRELLRANPELQIAATTHSPYLLNRVQPEEVRMTTLRDVGTTLCDSFRNHPQFEKWKDEMAPGEM